jgi:hypothetical protein
MKVYDLLVENGFIIESSLGENTVHVCNENIFLLDFLNSKGFIVLNGQNTLGLDDAMFYEYGCDSYSGRVKIIFKNDFTNQLHIKFECRKPER